MRKNRSIMEGTLRIGLAVVALVVTSAPAATQSMDQRWLPWLGCWEPVAEAGTDEIVCVRPTEESSAVEVLRYDGAEVLAREVLWADGGRHPTDREGCDGWDRGSFSSDMLRVFLSSEHSCEGGVSQKGAGIMTISGPDEWLDIRVMGMGDERMAWVQRFRVVTDERVDEAGFREVVDEHGWSAGTARLIARAPLNVDDVIEASAAAPTEAVEALLAERSDRLELSAGELVRMADAGVAESVIDIAVATSYPERFEVAAGPEQARVAVPMARGYRTFMSPFFYDPFYYYSPWSLRYGYGGYGYFGGYGYGYGYGYRPSVVVVDRVQQPHGRLVRGRGYTRSGGSSRPSSSGRTGISRSRGGVSGGGSSSGGSGVSSGGSGAKSSTGRTAKPRGGGEL
jgi:uncharacterized membrane protein YgcG